jgi:hypothetical protein
MARVRTLTLVAVTTAVTALGAGTASATVIDRGHYSSDPYAFSHDDCGFDVDVEGTASGQFHIRAGKGKTDTAFFQFDNYSFTETQTNPANGKFLTITANASFRETRAKRVEGNVFEFWAVESGQFRMFDSEGRLVARDRGSVQFHILFDTEGDDVPGGIFIEEFPPKVNGPHPGFDDFCGLITPLIGS